MAAAVLIRRNTTGEFHHLFLPSALWLLHLAAVLVLVLFANRAQGNQSGPRLFLFAAALAFLLSLAWGIGWGFGPVWDARSVLGMALTLYLGSALPLTLSLACVLWLRKLHAGQLVRSVVPLLAGFVGTLVMLPFLLVVGCTLTGDCL